MNVGPFHYEKYENGEKKRRVLQRNKKSQKYQKLYLEENTVKNLTYPPESNPFHYSLSLADSYNLLNTNPQPSSPTLSRQ